MKWHDLDKHLVRCWIDYENDIGMLINNEMKCYMLIYYVVRLYENSPCGIVLPCLGLIFKLSNLFCLSVK